MKNIHLLLAGESYLSLNCSYRDSAIGTEVRKPYWTYTKDWKHYMSVTDASVRPHNIYITSDEEIKEGDWFLDDNNQISHSYRLSHVKFANPKKIILTTNQDLIKDGIQEIPDEFLEWFVKNPSCEMVEVQKFNGFAEDYLIIIPKEEPKQETLEEAFLKSFFGDKISINSDIGKSFELGAKWQKERMYSEEDMREAFENGVGSGKYQAEYGDNAKGSMNFEYFMKNLKTNKI